MTTKIAAAHNSLFALRTGAPGRAEVWLYQYNRWEQITLPDELRTPVDIACTAVPDNAEHVVDVTLYVLRHDGAIWERNIYGEWRRVE